MDIKHISISQTRPTPPVVILKEALIKAVKNPGNNQKEMVNVK
jgi:hypothetical protein